MFKSNLFLRVRAITNKGSITHAKRIETKSKKINGGGRGGGWESEGLGGVVR